MNGTGTSSEGITFGRCSVDEQRRPNHHPTIARTKWSEEMDKLVIKCL